jgi:hypothetical protein
MCNISLFIKSRILRVNLVMLYQAFDNLNKKDLFICVVSGSVDPTDASSIPTGGRSIRFIWIFHLELKAQEHKNVSKNNLTNVCVNFTQSLEFVWVFTWEFLECMYNIWRCPFEIEHFFENFKPTFSELNQSLSEFY